MSGYALFWVAYLVLLPILAIIGRSPRRSILATDPPAPSLVVIVPAHDMADFIVDCIEAIRACAYPAGRLRIFVTADHCADDTARLASQAGAIALERNTDPAGKTYAIAWTLARLAELGVQADQYVITDATARVAPGFLAALSGRCRDGEDIVVGRSVAATEDQPWFVHCLGLTLVHRNFQNECRERLGLSSLIEGRGMGFSGAYVRRFGWSLALPTGDPMGAHPTEDWRHGVRAVEEGYRVAFAGDAIVNTPLRGSLAAATRQGMRWERGRMANAMTHGLRLLGKGFREGNLRKSLAALDAVQLPVAILGALAVAVAAVTLTWPMGGWVDFLGVLPMGLFFLYGLFVAIKGREVGIGLATIAWAPVYIAWRSLAFVLSWTRK